MTPKTLIATLILIGCGPPDGTDVQTESTTESTATGSSSTVTADGVSATCTAQEDNVLRFDCQVTLDEPASATLSFEAADGIQRIRSSENGDATTHAITLWGMRPETAYSWSVVVDGLTGPSGSLETGALPATLSDLEITRTGDDPVVEHLAYAGSCGGASFAIIVGTDGEVYWYQGFEGNGGALNLTDDETVILQAGRSILEYDMAGNLLLELGGNDFSAPIHHDVFKYDGHVYVLFADAYAVGNEEAVVDGLYVFDTSGTLTNTWELFDQITVTEADLADANDRFWEQDFPGAADYTHGNSVFVDDSGIYLSTRWISTVWKMKGLEKSRR